MHNRYTSTGQELKSTKYDASVEAMLHGRNRNRAGNGNSQRRVPEHAPSRSSSHQSVTQPNPPNKSPQQGIGGKRGGVDRKRKATATFSPRPAVRQRRNAPELKDEAYIRSTMKIPTPQEYPDLPENFFKTPRSSIYELTMGRGLAECRSEFTDLARGAYQCTAYYSSAMHNEAVIGEGRTKESRLPFAKYCILIVHRKAPKTPLGYISSQSFTSKVYSPRSWTENLARIRSTEILC